MPGCFSSTIAEMRLKKGAKLLQHQEELVWAAARGKTRAPAASVARPPSLKNARRFMTHLRRDVLASGPRLEAAPDRPLDTRHANPDPRAGIFVSFSDIELPYALLL
jgi:hypothetical protein